MQKSSPLLFASLLSMSLASFAMDQERPATPENSLDAFKKEAKELNADDFRHLRNQVKNPIYLYRAFGEEAGISFTTCQKLVKLAQVNQKLQGTASGLLLKKHHFPLAASENATTQIEAESTSCLHPVVMGLFSREFQERIQKRKTVLIEAKLQDDQDYESREGVTERIAFGMGILNTELSALRTEIINLKKKVTPFAIALKEIKRERYSEQGNMGDALRMMLLAQMLGGRLGGRATVMSSGLAGLMARMQSSSESDNAPRFAFKVGCDDPNCTNCGGKQDSSDKSE